LLAVAQRIGTKAVVNQETNDDGSTIGFISYISEGHTYRGGLLVVDLDGDPVDFAHTDPVKLNRVTRPLFGERFSGYLVGHVLAVPLLDGIGTKPAVLCFEEPGILARQVPFDLPLALLAPDAVACNSRWSRLDLSRDQGMEASWLAETKKKHKVRQILKKASSRFAPCLLSEPFERLRAALHEVGEE
jgi:hypothetical protein